MLDMLDKLDCPVKTVANVLSILTLGETPYGAWLDQLSERFNLDYEFSASIINKLAQTPYIRKAVIQGKLFYYIEKKYCSMLADFVLLNSDCFFEAEKPDTICAIIRSPINEHNHRSV